MVQTVRKQTGELLIHIAIIIRHWGKFTRAFQEESKALLGLIQVFSFNNGVPEGICHPSIQVSLQRQLILCAFAIGHAKNYEDVSISIRSQFELWIERTTLAMRRILYLQQNPRTVPDYNSALLVKEDVLPPPSPHGTKLEHASRNDLELVQIKTKYIEHEKLEDIVDAAHLEEAAELVQLDKYVAIRDGEKSDDSTGDEEERIAVSSGFTGAKPTFQDTSAPNTFKNLRRQARIAWKLNSAHCVKRKTFDQHHKVNSRKLVPIMTFGFGLHKLTDTTVPATFSTFTGASSLQGFRPNKLKGGWKLREDQFGESLQSDKDEESKDQKGRDSDDGTPPSNMESSISWKPGFSILGSDPIGGIDMIKNTFMKARK